MAYSEWITETNGVKWRYNSGNVITNQAAAEIVIFGITYYGLYYYDRNWPGYGIRFQSNITSLESNPSWNGTWHYYKKFKANTKHASTSVGGNVGTLSNDTSFYLATYWLASKDDKGNYPSKSYPMLVSTQTSSSTYWMQIEGLCYNFTVTFDPNGGDLAGLSPFVTTTTGQITIIERYPVRPGYEFTGWTTNADGSGGVYFCGQTYTITSSFTLYARWSRRNIVRIFNGTKWKEAVPYVFNGTDWQEAQAQVYDGSNWKIVSG